MSSSYRRSTRFRILSLIYFGIALTIFPSMLVGGINHLPELLGELASRLGEALLVAGVIWLLLDLFYGRVEEMFGEHQTLTSKGIKSLKELNTKNIEENLDYFSTSPQIALQFNVHEANRITLELVNTLQQIKRQKVQILVTGLRREEFKEVSRQTESSFVTRMLTELLERSLIQNNEKGDIYVKITPEPTFHTLLLGERNVLLVVPYGVKREDSILFNIDLSSQLAKQYQQQFEELWEKADEY